MAGKINTAGGTALDIRVKWAAQQTADQINGLATDTALLSDQSGRFALVVNDKDAVEVRRIKIGALDGGMRVVLEGLSPTDRIIINGLQRARPGISVKPTLKEAGAAGGESPAPSSGPHV